MNSQLLPTQDVQREIWLAASFHLPFPLGYLSDPQFANWKNIRKQIKDLLLQGEKEFEILNVPTNGHVRFPGGDPIGIKYNRFWKTINLEYRLRTSGLIPANSNLLLNHQIWICPHGTVLLVGKLTLDAIAQKIRIEDLDKTVQSIYAEFSKVFLNIVQALKPFCRKTIIPDVMCFRKDQSIIKNFVMCESSSLDDEADFQNLDCEDKDEMVELLEDVYYVDFVPKTDGLLLNIGYFSSEVHVEPDNLEAYGMTILTAFAAFREMLWINESLVAFSDRMQAGLYDLHGSASDVISSIRLIRLTCLRFIDESRPMQIRLTREFMECLEQCWTEFRMHNLVQQIRDRLATLVETGEWFESIRREIRNFRIGAVGVVFTALSFLTVAIAFVDLVYKIPRDYGRIAYVLAGGAGGVLLALAILVSPSSFWYWTIRSSLPQKRKSRNRK